MNKMLSKDELAGQKIETPWALKDRADKFELIAQMLNRNGTKNFASVLDIERKKDELRDLPIAAGSILEIIAGYVSGQSNTAIHTVGELMDASGMTQEDLHHVACYCHSSTTSGEVAALRLRTCIMPRKK